MGFNSIFSKQDTDALELNTVNDLYKDNYVSGKISQITLRDTYSRTAQEEYDKLFVDKVGWYDEFRASVELSFSDYTTLGVAGTFLAKNAISFTKEMNEPLTSYDWQHSDDYRPGIQYYDGMNKIQAKMLSQNYDIREFNKELIQKGGYKSAEIIGSLTGGMADPLLMLGAGWLNKAMQLGKLAEVGFLASKPILARGLIGGLQNTALSFALEPLVKYSKETYGDVYGWHDFTMSSLGAFGLGFVTGVGEGAWNWFENSKIESKQDMLKGIKSIQNQASNLGENIIVPENLRDVVRENFIEMEPGKIELREEFEGVDEILNPEWETQFKGVKETEFGGVENLNEQRGDNVEFFNDESKIIEKDGDIVSNESLEFNIIENYEKEIDRFLADENINQELKKDIISSKENVDLFDKLTKDENFLQNIMKCII